MPSSVSSHPWLHWILVLATWTTAGRLAAATDTHVFHHENVLGTALELRVAADSESAARKAEEAALVEIDRLDAIFSTYDSSSEFSRWQRSAGEPVPVSPELFAIMQRAEAWRVRSGGAFNAGAAVFTRLWREAAQQGAEPDAADLQAWAARISAPAWRLDESALTAARLADYPVTLDAVAKGYIVDRAGQAALAASPTLSSLVVNIGGDLRIWGATAYPVAVTDPRSAADNAEPIERVSLSAAALATSGGYRRGVTVDGRLRSHLFDPRTGQPVDRILSSSVVAADAAQADLLATVVSVLDPLESARLFRELPDAGFLVVTNDGGVVRAGAWPGGASAAEVMAATAAPSSAAAPFWGDTHELVVNFEVNSPATSRRYARPYVAIWIENEAGQSVRTLLVWYDRPRWLPDLRRWTRADAARARTDSTDVLAISSDATRGPGLYYLKWDGRDDAKRPLPPGTYTVYLEAVREHGTYGLMQQTVKVGGDPFAVTVAGNEEIKEARLEYRSREPAR